MGWAGVGFLANTGVVESLTECTVVLSLLGPEVDGTFIRGTYVGLLYLVNSAGS